MTYQRGPSKSEANSEFCHCPWQNWEWVNVPDGIMGDFRQAWGHWMARWPRELRYCLPSLITRVQSEEPTAWRREPALQAIFWSLCVSCETDRDTHTNVKNGDLNAQTLSLPKHFTVGVTLEPSVPACGESLRVSFPIPRPVTSHGGLKVLTTKKSCHKGWTTVSFIV